MIDVNKRLDEAIRRYQEAKVEIAHASVYLLCTLVRDEFPQAKSITFEWSDQGGWLTLSHYDDGDPDSGDEGDFGEFDDESLSSNLGDDAESVWGAYMDDDSGRRYTMNIDDALGKSAAALGDTPPSPADPEAIEEFLTS